MTETEAFEAMLAHHRSLTEGVHARAAALHAAVANGGSYEVRVAELVTYLAQEVLPHALAEEQTIYPVAARDVDLVATVDAMTAEHQRLADLSERLARAGEGQEALAVASTIEPLFAAHVDKENDLLLPRLRADGALVDLLAQMHGVLEGIGPKAERGAAGPVEGSLEPVLALLLEASKALSASGQGDRACRLVAAAWAALRRQRPDLAVRATAALHGLVRTGTAVPVQFGRGSAGGEAAPEEVLDVRDLAPAQRHEVIFATYSGLRPATSFVLVNDHDPKPLYYQFAAEHPGEFTWEYAEAGPRVWRVRIGRAATQVTAR
ncbi:MAG TPA: DUF2249 domain-containing protein [Acidimicrobiales bacterium]|nr:DUF2249 domain-containing protein [Acidimicrobiales bacterium]